jgi:Uma2 family endonuclease
MRTIAAARYTPEDLLTMPGGKRYELVNGQPVEKPLEAEADWIANELRALVRSFVKTHRCGDSFGPETGYQCFRNVPNKVCKPDGSFISSGRLPGGRIPKGPLRVVPDLVMEVISPTDRYSVVETKVHESLEAGVRLIRGVNPDHRMVKVYRLGSPACRELRAKEEPTDGDVLPGFRCAVAGLFPPAAEAAQA